MRWACYGTLPVPQWCCSEYLPLGRTFRHRVTQKWWRLGILLCSCSGTSGYV